jgi:hypothetical protein
MKIQDGNKLLIAIFLLKHVGAIVKNKNKQV